MRIPRSFLRAAVLAALGVGATRLSAQTTTGNIGGRVIGASGEGVASAQVQVTNGATGHLVGATTRNDGTYFVAGLEVGDDYRVVVRRIGFAPQTVQPVH